MNLLLISFISLSIASTGCSYHVIDSNQELINQSLVDKNYTGGVTDVQQTKNGEIIIKSKGDKNE